MRRRINQVVHVSATPADYELQQAGGVFVEQVIRPTGLVDPPIEIRPVIGSRVGAGQVDDLLHEVRLTVAQGERVLVTTLTKRMAEELTNYYEELGVRVRYLHSDIDTIERMQILRSLRLGEFDVLVGINLLREGLDLPEVSLVAILDADKEGFLRSTRSLIQTCGRAARNVDGTGADVCRPGHPIDAGLSRRNRAAPRPSSWPTTSSTASPRKRSRRGCAAFWNRSRNRITAAVPLVADLAEEYGNDLRQIPKLVKKLRKEMLAAAKDLDFEKAAELRDRIKQLEDAELKLR